MNMDVLKKAFEETAMREKITMAKADELIKGFEIDKITLDEYKDPNWKWDWGTLPTQPPCPTQFTPAYVDAERRVKDLIADEGRLKAVTLSLKDKIKDQQNQLTEAQKRRVSLDREVAELASLKDELMKQVKALQRQMGLLLDYDGGQFEPREA